MPKIIQIAVASDAENGESLYGLGDDGELYEYAYTRHANRTPRYGEPWWRKVPMPFEDPDPLTAEEQGK